MPAVLHLERARGVHPDLRALLDEWAKHGSHDIVVAPNGGVRTDEKLQAQLAAGGSSKATTLRSTPHGRAAALDVWPVSFLPYVPAANGGTGKRWVSWENLPELVRREFHVFGLFAETQGFEWGGRWRDEVFKTGDQPHVQMKGWKTMPFPPPVFL
ncbi:MAG: hypothetical protein DI536_28945 [Archangium gephyra]|uniref:Peptidase M15C domain-containing protein n=1 Tax=Archangium gephyra TaxID=48 RepID=A0A2W5T4I7_9BACT|nr:MAG: hypothetical protein DI536_28945 [Archangium gephyra]